MNLEQKIEQFEVIWRIWRFYSLIYACWFESFLQIQILTYQHMDGRKLKFNIFLEIKYFLHLIYHFIIPNHIHFKSTSSIFFTFYYAYFYTELDFFAFCMFLLHETSTFFDSIQFFKFLPQWIDALDKN